MRILFISDFFTDSVIFERAPGGAELNDLVLIEHLQGDNFEVEKINSSRCRKGDVQGADFVILSNFVGLSLDMRDYLISDGRYLIYEHDHKYVSTRDPSKFKNFSIP